MLEETKVEIIVTVSVFVNNLHSNSDYTASNDWTIVNNELQRIQMEVVSALIDQEKSRKTSA
jgi:hypothetical protein